VKRRIAFIYLRITQDAEQVNIVLARRGPSFAGRRVSIILKKYLPVAHQGMIYL